MMLQTEVPSKFTKIQKQKKTFNKNIQTHIQTKKDKRKYIIKTINREKQVQQRILEFTQLL